MADNYGEPPPTLGERILLDAQAKRALRATVEPPPAATTDLHFAVCWLDGTATLLRSTERASGATTAEVGPACARCVQFELQSPGLAAHLTRAVHAIRSRRQPKVEGNTLMVDAVAGDDALGQREWHPFRTIGAALAAALPGDLVVVRPGAYDEAVVIPTGVAVQGTNLAVTRVQKLDVAASTDLVTMGEGTRIENIDLVLTTAARGLQLRGVVFPGTTAATAKIRTATVRVSDAASNPAGAANNLYGIHSTGTGQPGTGVDAVRAATITVNGVGLGSKRGLLVDAANSFGSRDANYVVTRAGAAVGSYIGVETNHANALARVRVGSLAGPTADISRTLGVLRIDGVNLTNSNANGLGFDVVLQRPILIWGVAGPLPAGVTRFLRPGAGGSTTTEVRLAFGQKCVLKNLQVRAEVGPGAARVDQFVVRRSGSSTPLAVTLTGAQVSNANTSASATFQAGEEVAIQYTSAAGTSTDNVYVSVEVY